MIILNSCPSELIVNGGGTAALVLLGLLLSQMTLVQRMVHFCKSHKIVTQGSHLLGAAGAMCLHCSELVMENDKHGNLFGTERLRPFLLLAPSSLGDIQLDLSL